MPTGVLVFVGFVTNVGGNENHIVGEAERNFFVVGLNECEIDGERLSLSFIENAGIALNGGLVFVGAFVAKVGGNENHIVGAEERYCAVVEEVKM